MDLKSGYPFWAIKYGLMHAFPRLQGDLRCDMLVVGGGIGIGGALIADELAEHGHDVAVVEQRNIGWGSSAASTALLQYEIDTHMTKLAERFGEADAALAYRACADAIPMLQALAAEVHDFDFARMRSLYYASGRRDVPVLQAERVMRRKHGFDLSWIEADALRQDYGIDAPGAILSQLATQMNPYRMAYRLFARREKRDTSVFDRTRIQRIETTSRGVTLHSGDGVRLRAHHVVFTTGYAGVAVAEATRRAQPQQLRLHHRSAGRIEPARAGRHDGVGIGPPLPLPAQHRRWTPAGRRRRDAIDIPSRRDARVEMKAARLVSKVAKAMPGLALTPAFAWAGTFAETEHGLPFFGPHAQYGPRLQFAMAYGGNGITCSMLGAGLIRALIERRKHPLAALFSFRRLKC